MVDPFLIMPQTSPAKSLVLAIEGKTTTDSGKMFCLPLLMHQHINLQTNQRFKTYVYKKLTSIQTHDARKKFQFNAN